MEDGFKTSQYAVMPDQSIRLYDALDDVPNIAALLQGNGILITNLSVEGDTLENYYVRMIGGAGK